MNVRERLSNLNAEQSSLRMVNDPGILSVHKTPYIQPNPSMFCIFCSTANHHSHECQKYNSSKPFWEKVLVDRRCKNCLRLFHRSDKCFNRSYCRLFGCKRTDKHNSVLCHVRYAKYQKPYFRCENPWSMGSWPHISVPHFPKKRQQKVNVNFNSKYDVGPRNRVNTRNSSNLVNCTSNSSGDSVAVVKFDAATQTDCVPNRGDFEDKISQCCQTENSLVTTSMNTALRIHKDTDIFQYFPLPGQDNSSARSKSDVIGQENWSQQSNTRNVTSSGSAATLPSFLYSAVNKLTEISNNISKVPVKDSTSYSLFSPRK